MLASVETGRALPTAARDVNAGAATSDPLAFFMKQGTSFFLDTLRAASALGVFAGHCLMPWFSSLDSGRHWEIGRHACVVVFFVLSGYLITYTTVGRGRTWRQYVAARLARLYSVALPALVVTAALWLIGGALAPAHYADFDRGHDALRFVATAFFLNETWFFSAAPPTNMPFWSLAYEFWYYAIFGAAFFARGRIWSWVAPLLAALICGPKVLLLFPVWLAGSAAFFAGKKFALSPGWTGFGLAVLGGICAAGAPRVGIPLEQFGHPPLFFSGLFWSDIALGMVLAAAIFFGDQLFGNARVPAAMGVPVKAFAGVTFSIYLLHFPLLIFASAIVPYDKSNPVAVAGVGCAVLLTAIALGYGFERRATLKALSGWIESAFAKMGRGAP